MLFGMDLSFIWPAVVAALPTIIGGGFFVLLIWWLSKSSSAVFRANYLGLAIQAVRFVENELENNPNPTINKADMALKVFIDLYTAHTGATPTVAVQSWFKVSKEEILVELAKAQLTATKAPVVPAPVAPVAPVSVPLPTAVSAPSA